jgi:NAD(P)-dependent dehydrogenase (short-subunit alcohol dehydrogenase family)
MKLKDKIALVTGGARGIGAAIADRYIAEGARVAIADISLAQAEERAARHGDKAIALALDVTKTASIDTAVEAVVQRWGGVDILVNNAGIFDMVRSSR